MQAATPMPWICRPTVRSEQWAVSADGSPFVCEGTVLAQPGNPVSHRGLRFPGPADGVGRSGVSIS